MNQKGISMVQTIVAMGLLSGVGLTLMMTMDTEKKGQTKLTFDQEVAAITKEVETKMRSHRNCMVNLPNKKPMDFDLSNPDASNPEAVLTEIRKGMYVAPSYVSVGNIIETGQVIESSGLKVHAIRLIRKRVQNADSTWTELGDAIRITFTHKKDYDASNNLASGARRIYKDILVDGEKDLNGFYTRCISPGEQIISDAKAANCEALNGSWNETTKRCTLDKLPKCFLSDSCPASGHVDSGEFSFSGTKWARNRCVTSFAKNCVVPTGKPDNYSQTLYCDNDPSCSVYTDDGQPAPDGRWCYARTKWPCVAETVPDPRILRRCCRP